MNKKIYTLILPLTALPLPHTTFATQKNRSPLHLAIENNYFNLLRSLLQQEHITVNNLCDDVKENNLEKLKKDLMKFPQHIDTYDDKGNTPFITAINYKALPIIQLLLKHNADINKKNKKDNAPLKIAANKGFTNILLLILTHKDIKIPKNINKKSLHDKLTKEKKPLLNHMLFIELHNDNIFFDKTISFHGLKKLFTTQEILGHQLAQNTSLENPHDLFKQKKTTLISGFSTKYDLPSLIIYIILLHLY